MGRAERHFQENNLKTLYFPFAQVLGSVRQARVPGSGHRTPHYCLVIYEFSKCLS